MDAALPLLIVLAWGVLFLRGLAGIARTPKLLPSRERVESTVRAFVPARNEAEVIEQSARGLDVQGDALTSFIVVDDGSTDGTKAILDTLRPQFARLQVLEGIGPGDGECGKPAALRFAVSEHGGSEDWYLFLDADVILQPGALEALLGHAEQTGADLVTVFPEMVMESLAEKIVMPAVGGLVAAVHPAESIADPDSDLAFANGQLILVRRTVYEAVGGHGRVVGEILEDVRLAEAIKSAGYAIAVADGRRIARTRMYAGWSEMLEGWSKNLYLLLGSSRSRSLEWAILAVAIGGAGWVALALGGWPWGVVAYGLILAMQMTLRGLGGLAPGWAILAPVGAVLTSGIILRSMRLHRNRAPIPWKGRTY